MGEIYVVGRVKDLTKPLEWEICGVFLSRVHAVNVCQDATYFVGPIIPNTFIEPTVVWPGAFYPKAGVVRN